MESILTYKHENAMQAISSYKNELARKIQNGETEETFQTGSQSFTQKEWKKIVEHVDKDIEAVKEEQKRRWEKIDEEKQAKELYEKMSSENQCKGQTIRDRVSQKEIDVPYSYLAKDGVIEYNGVVFVCDKEKHAICLGDMSDKKNILTIPLEQGGCLMVNRDNLGDLSKAMEMFSPEDKKRIMWAIATDKKCKSAQEEIEEDRNSIGESAEETLDE